MTNMSTGELYLDSSLAGDYQKWTAGLMVGRDRCGDVGVRSLVKFPAGSGGWYGCHSGVCPAGDCILRCLQTCSVAAERQTMAEGRRRLTPHCCTPLLLVDRMLSLF